MVKINTVGNEMNQLKEVDDLPDGMKALPEDPECCCCTRDLWVGCWGWCGDGSDSTPTLSEKAPPFRAGEGALPGQVGGPCRGEYPLDEVTYPGNGAPRVDSDPKGKDCDGIGRRHTFSKVSALVHLLYKDTIESTFQNVSSKDCDGIGRRPGKEPRIEEGENGGDGGGGTEEEGAEGKNGKKWNKSPAGPSPLPKNGKKWNLQ